MLLVSMLLPVMPGSLHGKGLGAERQIVIDRIDSLLAQRWTEAGVIPAPLASDSRFLRRAYLDLTGVIPAVSRVREFLGDTDPNKRARLVDTLLKSPAHARHLATTWRNILLPRDVDLGQLEQLVGVQNWLWRQFRNNQRYDNLVGDLLVATDGDQRGPALFYTSVELKPEELAAGTSRIFLGLRIQCAQCHDHPYDRWAQQDFWGYASFFARLSQTSPNRGQAMFRLVDLNDGEVTLPGTDTVVLPNFPGGVADQQEDYGTRREQLAIWIVSRDNPYFARAALNRVWALLFGRGLVDPVDDLGEHNPPSHPRLLDELTDYFVDIGFDLRELIRTLANTKAYHRSSRSSDSPIEPDELFAQMITKSLTPEQLYDSLLQASRQLTMREATYPSPESRRSTRLTDPSRLEFIAKMASVNGSASEYHSGVPQALLMMNGPHISQATSQGGLLSGLEAPFFTDKERVETLFMATLSRLPNDDELSTSVDYVKQQDADGNRSQALGDILWALLNCAEFALNP